MDENSPTPMPVGEVKKRGRGRPPIAGGPKRMPIQKSTVDDSGSDFESFNKNQPKVQTRRGRPPKINQLKPKGPKTATIEDSDIEIIDGDEEKPDFKKTDQAGKENVVDENSPSGGSIQTKRTTRRRGSSDVLKMLFKRSPEKGSKKTETDASEDEQIGGNIQSKKLVSGKSQRANAILSSDDEAINDSASNNIVCSIVDKEDDTEELKIIPQKRVVINTSEESDDNVVKPARKRAKLTTKKDERKPVRVEWSSESEASEDEVTLIELTPKGRQRKNIRRLMGNKEMTKSTLDAQAGERERKKRILLLQKKYNNTIAASSNAFPNGATNFGTLVLEKNQETGHTLIEVHPDLFRELKPHQIDGVRFMYTSVIESVKRLGQPPGGCILAHCMGLGKTLQVITFLHTLLTNESFHLRTALVLAPVNVVLNWKNEVDRWMGDTLNLETWELATRKTQMDRLKILGAWQEEGGVMIMGYDVFRLMASGKNIKNKDTKQRFEKALLDPGADIIVCDEGHILKNEKTGTSQVVNRVKTPRRICLTGTPLQNNLSEYHCMVQFVKPNLLGSKLEFKNRFENPVKNGQCIDSTPFDVRLMKQRAHVLHALLDGCVHRRDYAVLTSVLPPRQEYVINIRLSDKQIELYRAYLADMVGDLDLASLRDRKNLFSDFQTLQRVWTHPYALYYQQLEVERKKDELDGFIVSEETTTSGSSSESDADEKGKQQQKDDSSDEEIRRRPRTRQNPGPEKSGFKQTDRPETPLEFRGWWSTLLTEDDYSNIEMSGKMVLLFEILKKCEEIGDKLLVFSQSLTSLAIIEKFLAILDGEADNQPDNQGWTFGLDYFRMDGSTTAPVRKRYIDSFNDPQNLRGRLFLISTKAGSLGTNLVGANRVIIFDANWNPTHDIQAIFRAYRYGQTKPVYIYRFIAQGSMEERIYDRQVTKQSLALRVVDEQQIERHFSAADLEALYKFEPVDLVEKMKKPVLAPPKDLLLRDIMLDKSEWFISYHEHDSLLQHKEEESLTEEEKKAAWDGYKAEREGRKNLEKKKKEKNAAAASDSDDMSSEDFVDQLHTVQKLKEQGNRMADRLTEFDPFRFDERSGSESSVDGESLSEFDCNVD